MENNVIGPLKGVANHLWSNYRGWVLIALNLAFLMFIGPDLFSAASTIANLIGYGVLVSILVLDYLFLRDRGFIARIKQIVSDRIDNA